MVWIGFDIGSSSVKAALIDAQDGRPLAVEQQPEREMPITSLEPGWGEQDPELWWKHLCTAIGKLIQNNNWDKKDIKGIGISYQMHGLVVVDKKLRPLRPSIIWCDSRAVGTGDRLFKAAGEERCVNRLLNSPGNFTLSKLKWVQENQPHIYKDIHKFMLPGDYIALKLSGECVTTPTGLSEGILWDFREDRLADWLLESSGINPDLVPDIRPSFSHQGSVSPQAAQESGLPVGIPIMYRAGDQPNNALSLGVMNPGEIAATGGTSGVVYAVAGEVGTREPTRINSFAHINHSAGNPRIGKLLCINGSGIQYSWIKNELGGALSYDRMNRLAENIPVGAEGLRILPFGNGAERMLENIDRGSQILGLNFNRHKAPHLYRAALEGIAFSFVYGMEILKKEGVAIASIKAGNDNLFRAGIFAGTIATLAQTTIDIVETTGAVGAARAAAYSFGDFRDMAQATATDAVELTHRPEPDMEPYFEAYREWKKGLKNYLDN